MNAIQNGNHANSSAKGENSDLYQAEPQPLEKYNWLMHMYHVRGEKDLCLNLIKLEIERSNGKNEFSHFKKGVILQEDGKVQEALECFRICHRLNPTNIENIKRIANCLFLQNRHKLALEAYLEAEKTLKNSGWEISYNIGKCYLSLGDRSKALEYASKSVNLGKQECSYELLIKILNLEKRYEEALSVSNAALEFNSDSTSMLVESGLLYARLGKTQESFERLSSALAIEPECKKALLAVGCIMQTHDEFDVALSKYKTAIQLQKESVPLWNNIGMCFYGKQKYMAAISCLKRALWNSKLNWKVLCNIGMVYLKTDQPASAFNFLCGAVNCNPANANAFMLLGCSLMKLYDFENALRALKQAVFLSPEDAGILANLALCHFYAEDYAECDRILAMYRNAAQDSAEQISQGVVDLTLQLQALMKDFENFGAAKSASERVLSTDEV